MNIRKKMLSLIVAIGLTMGSLQCANYASEASIFGAVGVAGLLATKTCLFKSQSQNKKIAQALLSPSIAASFVGILGLSVYTAGRLFFNR